MGRQPSSESGPPPPNRRSLEDGSPDIDANDLPPIFIDSDDEEEDEPNHNFPKDSEGDLISSFLTEFQLFELSLEDDRTDFLRMFSSEDEQADLRTMVDELEQKAVDSAAPTRLTRLLFYLNSIPEDASLSSIMWEQINSGIVDYVRKPLTLNRGSALDNASTDDSQGFTLPKKLIQEEVQKLDKLINGVKSVSKELAKKDEELNSIREIYIEAKVVAKAELQQKSVQLSKAEAEIKERSEQWKAEKAKLQLQIQNSVASKQQANDARKFKQQVRLGHTNSSLPMFSCLGVPGLLFGGRCFRFHKQSR